MKRKTQVRKLGQAHRVRRARACTPPESMGHPIATRISVRAPQGTAQAEQEGTAHAEQ